MNIYKEHFVFFILLLALGRLAAQEDDAASAVSRMNETLKVQAEGFSPQDGYYIGRAVAADIFSRYALYTGNPALTRYLNMVCGALAVNSPSPHWYNGYHVMLLDAGTPNAFSTPGGHIFLTRGIVKLVSSEDMLAAIIAHELAHIQLRHGLAEIKQERFVRDLSELQNELARIAAPDGSQQEANRLLGESVREIANTLFAKGYSQLQELEADALAVNLLASAGYDPNSLTELLITIFRHKAEQGGGFASTHPVPAQRIASAEKQASRYRLPNTRQFRTARFNRAVPRH